MTLFLSMRKQLVLIFFIPAGALAQKFSADRPDEIAKPNPFTNIYFADNNNYKQIESVCTIAKNRYNNFKSDTLSIDFYNKGGLKVKSLRYDNNRMSTTSQFKYDAGGKLLSWQSFEKQSSTLTLYKYNQKGQLMETHKYNISNKNLKADTTEASRMLFKYNGDKLVQISNNSLGSDITEKFLYQQNRLVSTTGGYVSKEFFYHNNDKPAGIHEYMGGVADSTRIMGLEKLLYNSKGLLISDSVLTSSNFKTNSWQVIEYTYNDKDILAAMSSRYNDFYRRVSFKYSDGKMQEVDLETNGNSGFLRFIINHKIAEYYTFPIQYKEQFGNDRHGNRTFKKVLVNNELFSEVNYLIKYKN